MTGVSTESVVPFKFYLDVESPSEGPRGLYGQPVVKVGRRHVGSTQVVSDDSLYIIGIIIGSGGVYHEWCTCPNGCLTSFTTLHP